MLLFFCSGFYTTILAQHVVHTWQVPAGDLFCMIDTTGRSVLPSGRFVTPVGKVVRITRSPFGLAVSPDGSKGLVLHQTGVVTVVDLNKPSEAVRVPSYDKKIAGLGNDAFLGVVFSKDNRTVYLSGGDKGTVLVFDAVNYQKLGEIPLDTIFGGVKFSDSFTSDLTIDQEKDELLVLDRGNNRLVRVDLKTRGIVGSVSVGRIPFGIALSPDKKTAFVANVGLYDYPIVPGVTPTNKDTMMLQFPAYGIPSKEGVVRPKDGYPFRHSFMADNDLALGRIISFLSNTPYWKNMLVVVTEDDPQGGVDHVDAHRSILTMVGPYVKRHYISHRHANFGAILKTMYHILGIPPVNQYDATASLLDDFFTDLPDITPYEWDSTDDRIFDPKKAMKVYGRNFDWHKVKRAGKLDNEKQLREDHYQQQDK